MCGWLIRYDPNVVANGHGPITASSSTALDARAPNINLALSLLHPARAGKPFALNIHITSEVTRELSWSARDWPADAPPTQQPTVASTS